MNASERAAVMTAAKKIIQVLGNGQRRPKKRTVKRKTPDPESNVGLIYGHLLAHANRRVASKVLEKLLLNRREAGERVSGDTASVSSDVNYLKKYYGIDIETVEIGVYKLHRPKRSRR